MRAGRLIRQRGDDDCAVCTLAMALGLGYEEVLAGLGDAWTPGVGLWDYALALRRLGYLVSEPPEYLTDYDAWVLPHGHQEPRALLATALGRRAIMTVPSVLEGTCHSVYWDGRHLWDPTRHDVHRVFAQLEPTQMVVFRER